MAASTAERQQDGGAGGDARRNSPGHEIPYAHGTLNRVVDVLREADAGEPLGELPQLARALGSSVAASLRPTSVG